jgi:CRP/FNR family transcriptional regulator, cyclic AMP receptor protein
MDMSHVNWISLIGYVASLLVFSTFYMNTMIPLRCVAMASNIAFLAYGYLAGLYPVFLLHTVLLPLNMLRLYQIRKRIERVRHASTGDYSIEWMLPFMQQEEFKKGESLFHKGDMADKLYYIERGAVRLPEIDGILGAGEIIGEIGIFSPLKERTTSAICETDVTCLVLSNNQVLELYYQNPEFGLYLGRLIIQRLLQQISCSMAIDVPYETSKLNVPEKGEGSVTKRLLSSHCSQG